MANSPVTTPGVSRADRISDEGLARLEKQLQRGAKISQAVRQQWVRRYGDDARRVLEAYGMAVD